MRYPSGEEVRLGDRVRVGETNQDVGVVVCSIDTGQHTPDYRPGEWEYLEKGILVEFAGMGLVHYLDDSLEPTLTLLARAAPPRPDV